MTGSAGSGQEPVAKAAARLLSAGTRASVVLVAAGVGLMLAAGLSPISDRGPDLDPSAILADVAALGPAGLSWVGLLLTVSLPTARVALALVGYARRGDRRAAAVAASVLAVLAVAFAVALATR